MDKSEKKLPSKATILSEGDMSVGISGTVSTIDFGFPIDDNERGWLRDELGKTFFELCDNGRIKVVFEDECACCMSKTCGFFKGEDA